MPPTDRMFHVIVAGGIALVAVPTAAATGCGGAVSTSAGDAGSHPDAFPVEGPAYYDAFPQEGPPPPFDAGLDADASQVLDAGSDIDAFPHEGPNIEAGFFDTGTLDTGALDSGAGDDASDAASAPDGFPQETAVP
jgi:hypothetical protein